MFDLDNLFQKSDLIPVIIQHAETKDILMLGFTNLEAVQLTLKTKTAWFWSRSRNELWNKGGTSGNFLHVKKVMTDCDTDTLLYFCIPDGPTCHTGRDRSGSQVPVGTCRQDKTRTVSSSESTATRSFWSFMVTDRVSTVPSGERTA